MTRNTYTQTIHLFKYAVALFSFIIQSNVHGQQSVLYKKIDSVKLYLKVYYPEAFEAKAQYPAMVFYFGGGWVSGDIGQFEPHAKYFSQRGMVCFLVDYRTKNKHNTTPFESLKDAKSAIRFIRKNASLFSIDTNKIVATGGSAGGQLAAATALINGFNENTDDLSTNCKPNALALFNPVIDNGPTGYGYDRIGNSYLEFSPLHNIQSAAPPTILFLGTEDKLVSVETAKNFQNAMRNVKARCELFLYKGQDHGFFNFRNIELYKQTIKELDTFLTSLQYLQASPASVMSYHYNDTSYIKKKVETQPKITPLISGVRLYDFEKAYFGRLRIDVSNLKAGDTFLVHIGEKLDGSGKIDRAPGGTIRYYTYKISKEEGDNLVFVPNLPEKRNTTGKAIRLPEQMGVLAPFRFAEIESVVDTKMINVSREVFHYRFNDNASSFISSDSVLNAIWDLCKHSIKATSFMGLYIDGDRERIPYEADALINQLSHYALDADFDIARNTFEYLMLHPTWPTEWQLQMHQIAWNDYLYSGNTHLISSYYDLLKSKTLEAFLQPNGLISSTAAPQRLSFLDSIYYKTFDAKQGLRDITDWPQRGNKIAGPEYIGESDGFVFCPYNSVVNAFYYQSLRLMKEFAILLGKQEDVKFYNRRIQEVYNQFNEVFVDKLTGLVRDGDTTQHSSFHANFFALCFGLIKEQNKTQVLSFIQSKDMACSVYGSQFLLDALYKEGLGDYGLTMLTKRDERSWYHMLELGAGMTMEAWDLKFKPNLDWNHAWGAAPSNIIAFRLMGIQPEAPGFSRALIRPEISRLTSAAIRLPTVKGEIVEKIEQTDESYTIEIQLPPQMIGRLELPMFNPNAKSIRINGKETVVKNNGKKYLLGNIQGTHHISIKK